jgi:hypothetical protein
MGQRRNLKCDAPSGLATDCGHGLPESNHLGV